ITWTSIDSDVATVNSQGMVTAAAFGTTTIIAASGAVADSADVVVNNPASEYRCQQAGYPCSMFDVPAEIREQSAAIGQAAFDKLAAGASVADIAAELSSTEGVVEVAADETAIIFRIDGGAPFWILSDAALAGSSSSTSSASTGTFSPSLSVPPMSPAVVGDDPEQKNALVLSPYQTEFGSADEGAEVAAILAGARGYEGNVDFMKNDAAGPASWVGWDAYDVVHISAHGAYLCNVGTIEGCTTGIYTGIPGTERNSWTDAGNEKLGVVGGVGPDGVTLVLTDDFFLSQYPGGLGETIVWMSACETTKSSAESGALGLWDILSVGGGIYFGWSNPVQSGVASDAAVTFYRFLSDNGVATDAGMAEVRRNGYDTDPNATLTRIASGASDLRLREIIWTLDPLTKAEVVDGVTYPLTGVPQDGKRDSLAFAIRVDGVEEGQAAGFTVHVSVDGVEVSNGGWSLADGEETEDYTWVLEKKAELLFDAEHEQEVDIRAWVDLPEGGLSEQTVTVTLSPPDLVLSWESEIQIQYPEHLFQLRAAAEVELALNEDGSAYIGSGTLEYLQNSMPEEDCVIELIDGTFQVVGLTVPSMPGAEDEIELTYTFNPGPKEVHTCNGSTFEFGLFTLEYTLLHLMLGEIKDLETAEGFVTVGWETNVEPPLIARKIIDYVLPADDGTTITEKTTFKIRRITPGS
ncbi:MAG TPA: Ig-like domain-containing protein, partial [Longimicrobiaceae bacterium]|nr:Ig-like domain-containing protein [Longimicrobiaceae bacterium]